MKRKVEVGYRYVPRSEYHTPLCHLPMQRGPLEVDEPCGRKEVLDALWEFFGDDFFESRDAIRDIEVNGKPVH